MIIEPFIVPALVLTIVLGGLLLLLDMIGATMYDFRQAKAAQHYRQNSHARRYRNRPLVSVIIPTDNAANTIIDCLDSLRLGSYRKFQVIVMDNCSSDDTVAIVRDWMAAHPKRQTKLTTKRKATTYTELLRTASRRHLQGELVLVLDPSERLETEALTRAVRHFNQQPTTDLLLPQHQVVANQTIAGLFARYLAVIGQRRAKWQSVTNASQLINSRGALYRLAAFRQALSAQQSSTGRSHSLSAVDKAGRRLKYTYANDVLLSGTTPTSLRALIARRYRRQCELLRLQVTQRVNDQSRYRWLQRLLTASNLLLGVLLPALMSYFIYLAVNLRQPLLLEVSAASLAAILISAIWAEESLRLRQKLSLIVGLPISYSLFYLAACWQVLSFLPLLYQSRRSLLRLESTSN